MYTFTTKNPPLLRKENNILDVPPANLRSNIGSPSRWIHNYEASKWPFERRRYYENTFFAHRFQYWHLAEHQVHLAADTRITLTETRGYTKTTKEAVSQFMEVDVHAAVSDMFSADVKGRLQIDNSTDQTWTATNGETQERTWLGGETYAVWVLIDTIRIQKTLVTWLYHDDDHKQTSNSAVNFDCCLFVFEDTTADRRRRPSTKRVSESLALDPSTILLSQQLFANMPCSKCSCINFTDVNFDGYCDNHGCGHDFDDHHY